MENKDTGMVVPAFIVKCIKTLPTMDTGANSLAENNPNAPEFTC